MYTCVIPQYLCREKFLNFIASYDVIDLPSSKLYSVIKKNLATSQALIYVRQVSRTHTRACPRVAHVSCSSSTRPLLRRSCAWAAGTETWRSGGSGSRALPGSPSLRW